MLCYTYDTGTQKHPNKKMETQRTKQEEITFRKEWIETLNFQIEGWHKEIFRIHEQISKLSQKRGEQFAILAELEEEC